jgi:hypothetical protein
MYAVEDKTSTRKTIHQRSLILGARHACLASPDYIQEPIPITTCNSQLRWARISSSAFPTSWPLRHPLETRATTLWARPRPSSNRPTHRCCSRLHQAISRRRSRYPPSSSLPCRRRPKLPQPLSLQRTHLSSVCLIYYTPTATSASPMRMTRLWLKSAWLSSCAVCPQLPLFSTNP